MTFDVIINNANLIFFPSFSPPLLLPFLPVSIPDDPYPYSPHSLDLLQYYSRVTGRSPLKVVFVSHPHRHIFKDWGIIASQRKGCQIIFFLCQNNSFFLALFQKWPNCFSPNFSNNSATGRQGMWCVSDCVVNAGRSTRNRKHGATMESIRKT